MTDALGVSTGLVAGTGADDKSVAAGGAWVETGSGVVTKEGGIRAAVREGVWSVGKVKLGSKTGARVTVGVGSGGGIIGSGAGLTEGDGVGTGAGAGGATTCTGSSNPLRRAMTIQSKVAPEVPLLSSWTVNP